MTEQTGRNLVPDRARLLIDGEWRAGRKTSEVHDKYTREVAAVIDMADRDDVDAAVKAARRAFLAGTPEPAERGRILRETARLVGERRAKIASTIAVETGFTIGDALGEVDRATETLRLSGEEACRLVGHMVPIAGAPGQSGRLAFTLRVPLGVVCAITPFNSPLNTVAHKIAPALAAGNAVVLKPATYTPLAATLLAECLLDAGLPPGLLSVVHGSGSEAGDALLSHPDIAFFGFTGSTGVGRLIQDRAGLRKTSLELGSIATTFVAADADLDRAAAKCVPAAFRKAGQVCTSIQRLYVARPVLEEFTERFLALTAKLGVGDPFAAGTVVGPMIAPAEAERADSWIKDAVSGGATLLAGGTREGAVVQPTVLTGVDASMNVMCEEIFGPVVNIVPFDDLSAAIDDANATPYGLASGIFTRDLNHALDLAERMQVGGVHINDTSSSRVDLMPYGGVKDSGNGREGPHYAIREMSAERIVTIQRG
ncbi:aldehyde dehydrogenase family protein [Fodinicurvata sp. EGI_FJ10296]|uniref:aldehyde dehydrogenase family protein n=1 Tax=Fodinicurvata sp. EGI_FJ10296 TaxID=3231908 RepID=UPI003452551B